MKRTKKNNKSNPDPYEGMLKLEKIDPYESLINSSLFHKKNNKSIK